MCTYERSAVDYLRTISGCCAAEKPGDVYLNLLAWMPCAVAELTERVQTNRMYKVLPQISPQKTENIRRWFVHANLDGDGKLDHDKLKALVSDKFQAAHIKQWFRIISSKYDHAGNGNLDVQEFLRAMTNIIKGDEVAQVCEYLKPTMFIWTKWLGCGPLTGSPSKTCLYVCINVCM